MYRRKPKGWLKHIDFVILDMICLQLAFIMAYVMRQDTGLPYHTSIYRNIAVVYAVVDFLVLVYNASMKNVLHRGLYLEVKSTLSHCVIVEGIVIIYLFIVQESNTYSRIVIGLTGVFYFLISYLFRVIWKEMIKKILEHNASASIFLLAEKSHIPNLESVVTQLNQGGYYVSGLCVLDEDCKGQRIAGVEVVENRGTILEYLCREWIDEVYLLESNYEEHKELISHLIEMGIVVHMEILNLPDLTEQKQVVEKLAGHKVLTVSVNLATGKQLFFKRLIDIFAGFAGCFITLLLIVILGPLIYIASPGPIFFSQTRIGQNGRRFKIYKFRSMYMDAEERKKELMAENRVADGMMFKLDFDPRIIGAKKHEDGTIKKGIGNIIRDYSLDEFPQFWNVLIGDMSLVGTRPPTEDEWNKYKLHHRARLSIKPGITGMWQVSGRSNITDFEDVVKLDRQYIQNWDLGMDIKIVLKTLNVVFRREGAM